MERYNVEFEKKVYSKQDFQRVVDRSFREFGQVPTESVKTVDQFFRDYEELYYKIPATGSVNSHQFLVDRSSQLYKADQEFIDIQPLIDEINALKQQNVEYQQQIVKLQLQLNDRDGKTSKILDEAGI